MVVQKSSVDEPALIKWQKYLRSYPPSALLYSTLLYSTLLYSTLLYSTLLYSTLLYSTLFYSTLLYFTCSIRIGENKTRSFSYSRGVRQRCILSPLLFNRYINNLPHLYYNTRTLSDPFVLPNGRKIISLLYADDLIILSS